MYGSSRREMTESGCVRSQPSLASARPVSESDASSRASCSHDMKVITRAKRSCPPSLAVYTASANRESPAHCPSSPTSRASRRSRSVWCMARRAGAISSARSGPPGTGTAEGAVAHAPLPPSAPVCLCASSALAAQAAAEGAGSAAAVVVVAAVAAALLACAERRRPRHHAAMPRASTCGVSSSSAATSPSAPDRRLASCSKRAWFASQ
mmetsp:Transcript_15232/g.39595  ORF Transcript_15232/g.39595 Transcript_15232/m.39595 type:complete len:209 (+) Transcript_15232:603-1229(+)